MIGRPQDGLFATWEKLAAPLTPLPVPALDPAGVTRQELGVGIGWSVALAVCIVLAYLTFLFRWPDANER